MPKRNQLNQQERSELVLRLLRKEDTARALASEAGISEGMLYQLRDKYLTAGNHAMAMGPAGDSETKRLHKEVSERDRIIGELTVANSVLKKSLGMPG